MTTLPLGLVPRGLTREQAAEYCGCESLQAFDDWVRKRIVPGPIPGTKRWDRKAIDRALDRHSGLTEVTSLSWEEWAAQHAD
ncbi:hypothetical protein [Methylobacterium nodulans]|uniref:Helix-turn-helix domain-containing protein n=1 Tax=Methylobacterium nodulans (strain LMG 21967 / CNCM I-2342 / ORS 2060) TaxID=460265 RepID=B8IAQ1_METNO|nr:hypothetical protein [Methylobacterium nodulans]ACL61096.1 conserved hypothetical protein [Methylobacterium nodulans ORS 2060]